MDAGVWIIAAALAGALVAGVVLWTRARGAAAAGFDFADIPPEPLKPRAPADGQVKGDLGEMIAALAHVGEGWRQIDAKYSGNRGVDGLFVRADPKRRGAVRVRLVEVKTGRGPYAAKQMADDKLIRGLSRRLEETGAEEAAKVRLLTRLVEALGRKRRDRRIEKQLWRVHLDEMVCEVTPLGRDGAAAGPTVRRGDLKPLFETVFIGLSLLDRREVYLPRPKPEPVVPPPA